MGSGGAAAPVSEGSSLRSISVRAGMTPRRWAVAGLVAVGLLLVFVADIGVVKAALALVACYLMFRIGFAVIGSFARPVPPPPPPGELRRVRMRFRCSLCGTEVRMTFANDEIARTPPPLHGGDGAGRPGRRVTSPASTGRCAPGPHRRPAPWRSLGRPVVLRDSCVVHRLWTDLGRITWL